MPDSYTQPEMSSGVSAEKVVATIDVPSSHQGMFRSAATKLFRPWRSPRRLREKATLRQNATYAATIRPSHSVRSNTIELAPLGGRACGSAGAVALLHPRGRNALILDQEDAVVGVGRKPLVQRRCLLLY